MELVIKELFPDYNHLNCKQELEQIATICLYLRHGITASSLKKIKWHDLDLREGELTNGKSKYILHDPEWYCIDLLYKEQTTGNTAVFSTDSVERVRRSAASWKRAARLYLEEAGSVINHGATSVTRNAA